MGKDDKQNESLIGVFSGYCTVTLTVVVWETAPDWAMTMIEAVPRFGCVLLPYPPQPPNARGSIGRRHGRRTEGASDPDNWRARERNVIREATRRSDRQDELSGLAGNDHSGRRGCTKGEIGVGNVDGYCRRRAPMQ
jgi:hypothetical protein